MGEAAEPYDIAPLITGEVVTKETHLGNERVLEVLAPLKSEDGRPVAALGLYMSLAEQEATMNIIATRAVVGSLLAAAAVIVLVSLVLHLLVGKRLWGLTRAGRRLQEGDLSARVEGSWEGPSRDEIATAVQQFNHMAESLERAMQRLEREALVDPLTNLFNRRYFGMILEAEMERARRLGDSLALLMVDVDHFKQFNDKYGHQAGDRALARIAEAIRENLRPMDTAARYGGEELVVILPGADAVGAVAAAERLRQAVAQATVGDGTGPLTVSIGVAIFPPHGESPSELVWEADRAMYEAKLAGRDRVCLARGSGHEAPMS